MTTLLLLKKQKYYKIAEFAFLININFQTQLWTSQQPGAYKDDKLSTAGSAFDDEENLPFNDYDDTKPIGMKESSRYWCKNEKRWKDNK